jgi:hypothetical protein
VFAEHIQGSGFKRAALAVNIDKAMLAQVFNRNVSKFIGAVSIPAVIMFFWFYALQEANKQVKEFNAAQKINPNTDETIVRHYELKEVDDNNQVRWLLSANEGKMEPVSHDVNLTQVHVDYMDGQILKMRLSAPFGHTNEITRLVKLSASGNKLVEAIGEAGKVKLTAAKIELNKKNQFQATGGVNIIWPGVAKVIGDLAAGILTSGDLNNVKIIGNTRALIGSLKE